jgi:heme/copper-type cytochrome/quinol oxidase subunit 2
MKPTVGLTSRYLVIPLSERQDSVGPMAKTVKDAGSKIITITTIIIIIIVITIIITIIIIIIIC